MFCASSVFQYSIMVRRYTVEQKCYLKETKLNVYVEAVVGLLYDPFTSLNVSLNRVLPFNLL